MTKNSTSSRSDLILDPYAVLGVGRDADQAEIKRAYFRLVRAHPPERDPQMFKHIRAAYERLRTPEVQARTDLFLLQRPSKPPMRRMPKLDLSLHPEDLLMAARSLGDLGRTDFRQDFRRIVARVSKQSS